MFGKLATLVLSIGAIACALLALRQSRLQAASELAQSQLRMAQLDQALGSLKASIAVHVAPERIQEMAEAMSDMRPLVEDSAPRLIAEYEKARGLEPLAGRRTAQANPPAGGQPR